MRVVHVTGVARRDGGTEAHVLALAAGQAARGDDVSILHAHGAAEIVPGVSTINAGAIALDALAADVVHIHGTPLGHAGESELHARYPVIRSLHDYSFGCASGAHYFRSGAACTRAHGPGCLAGIGVRGCAHRLDVRPALAHYRALGRILPLVRAAGAVVTYSRFVRDVALANGVPAERCHVIPYFVERAAAPLPVPPERRLAFVGRIVHMKGLDLALDALARVPGGWDELVVAGDGWDRPRCERLARSLGIADRVRFLGWQSASGVADVLRSARALLLPSRWPEPFGIAGIEALALGRPVVAAAVGGVPEWLDDGSSGFLVEANDPQALAAAIERVLDDETLGEAAWRSAARFSPASHLAALDAVYESTAAARGTEPAA